MTGTQTTDSGAFPFREVCGVIHLHTLHSDGGISLEELGATAQDVGLDFIVVTDHMTLKGREQGGERFRGKLLVLIGYEHNDIRNRNHYLVLGVDQVFEELGTANRYVHAVKKAGGIGFLAHPFEKRNFLQRYPPYPWTDWEVKGYDGIELWNQMSEWLENLKSYFQVLHLFHPRSFLREKPREYLDCWDSLCRERFVSAVAGVDAHTMKTRIGIFSLTIFPARVELKGLRTHAYLDDGFDTADVAGSKRMLMEALRDGHGFISNFRCGDARGALLWLTDASGRAMAPGTMKTMPDLPARIQVRLPASADIRLVRDGAVMASVSGQTGEFVIDGPGLYRLEIFRRNRAWIYSNPFPVGMYRTAGK